MATRKNPLLTDHIYHVYNQGIDRRVTFTDKREYFRALQTLQFYAYKQNYIKLSHYLVSGSSQLGILEKVKQSPKLVTILAYCLMPNHFHLVLRQKIDGGISKFLGDFQNSYTKYFNSKHERKGSLFLKPFKAIRVETDEQILHLVRYVHLNPYSSGLVASLDELFSYSYSSLPEYFDRGVRFEMCDTQFYQDYFSSEEKHRQFIVDQADYQRRLEIIKHISHEEEMFS